LISGTAFSKIPEYKSHENRSSESCGASFGQTRMDGETWWANNRFSQLFQKCV